MVKLRKGYKLDKNNYEIDDHGFATGRRLVTKKIMVTKKLYFAGVEPKASAIRTAKILRKSFSPVKIKKTFPNESKSDQYTIYIGNRKITKKTKPFGLNIMRTH